MNIGATMGQLVQLEEEASEAAAAINNANEVRVYEWRPTAPPELPAFWNEIVDGTPFNALGDDVMVIRCRIAVKPRTADETMAQLTALADTLGGALDANLSSETPLGAGAVRGRRSAPQIATDEINGIPMQCMDILLRLTVEQLANATLLEIARPGPLATNGDPGEPVSVWTGEAKVTLQQTFRDGTIGDRESQEKTVTLGLYDSVAPEHLISAGAVSTASTIVVRDESEQPPITARWTVNGISKREIDGTLDTVALELDNETAP